MPGRGSRAGKRPQRRNRTLALCRIGAETGGAALTSSLARVAVGAEAAGRPRFTARVGIGAEARGSTNTRALVPIGAEAAGGFSANLTYPNGYKHRIRVSIPAERIEATTTGFLAYFDETYTALRHTSLGGLVESVFGFDQRWELLDGTRLAYRRVLWDATTGRHIARILLPSVTAGQPVDLYLYLGRSVATDDQQPTAAYAGYALALNTRSGEDLTGQGRDFFATAVALPAGWESFTPLNVGTGGTHVLRNDTDYLIRNQTLTQSLRLQGGRRVVVMGLTITITRADWTTVGSSVTCGLFLEEGVTGGAPQANRAFYCEGIRMGGPNLTQGVLTYCPTADVYLSNIHVAGIRFDSCDHRDGTNGKTLNHPDLVQTTGSQKSLTIDGFTGYSAYQGLFFKEEENPQGGPIFLRRVDVRAIEHVGSDGISYPGNRMLWNESDQPLTIERGSVWVDGLPRNGHQDGGFYRERFFNGSTYELDPAPSLAAERDAVLPRPTVGGTDARGAFAYFAIDTAPEINGVVYLGTPPFEFVPSASVGVGYDPAAARAPVTAGSLIGEAGSFDGTASRLERAGLTALDGLPALTVEAWVSASSIGHSGAIVAGGPTTATADGAMGMVLRFDKVGNDTGGTNCVAFKVQCSDGTTRFESAPNAQVLDDELGRMYLAGQYQPGQAPRLWLNDAFLAQANTPVVRNGTVNVTRGGSLWVGFSPITDTDETTEPPPSDLFLNPFGILSAHHRPIGNGVRYGIPPTVESNNGAAVAGLEFTGTNIAARGRLATLRSFILQIDHRSVKCFMRPIAGDTNMVTKSIADGVGTRSWLMPRNSIEIFPPNAPPGERQVLLYPIDGAGNQAVLWNQFSYISETANIRRIYRLDGMDANEPGTSTTVGERGTSASQIRWPFGLLRGHEINDPNPGPIGHSFTLTATRQNQPDADHVVGRTRCWPAYDVDNSVVNADGTYNLAENKGDIPYGCCITFTPDDYFDIIVPALAGNARGLRVVEAIYYYGCYMMDGGGEPNRIAIRCDQRVGFNVRATADANGEFGRQIIAGVRDQIEAALEIARPYLMPVFNSQTYNTANRQLVRGFPFVGGGTGNGVRNSLAPAMSRNTAYDAPSPGYPTGPA